MNDIEAIREWHQQEGDFDACEYCGSKVVEDGWPCDTRIVLDALDNKTEIARAGIRLLDIEMDLHRATKADADRLAEALRAHWNARCEEWDDRDSDALRQHDKAAKVVA